MATIGLSKPYYAKYGAAGTAVTYTDGALMGKATEANIEIETTEDNNLYADNGIAETDKSFSGGTLTLSTDDLSQAVSKAILGAKETALSEMTGITDEDAGELIYDDDMTTPYLGVGMIVKKKHGGTLKWRAIILPKVMFSVPADAATTQGESIEWQVPELTATILRDDTDKHAWKKEATFTTEAQAEVYIKARLNITEGEKSTDATLAVLNVGDKTLTPAFAASTTSYTLDTTDTKNVVTAISAHVGATVEVKLGTTVKDNGTAITWATGENTLTVKVTAEDGTTTKTYTVTVTKS